MLHDPTGTLNIQKQYALSIRRAYRQRFHEVETLLSRLNLGPTSKEGFKEKKVPSSTNVILNVLTLAFHDLKEIINHFIKRTFEKAHKDTARVMNMQTITYSEAKLQALQNMNYHYIEKLSKNRIAKFKEVMEQGMSEGKSQQEILKDVKQSFNAVAWKSEQIARTEVVRAYNKATVEACKTSAFTDTVRFFTERDENVCLLCKPLNNKLININNMQNALLFPPLHPNCRCALHPHIKVEEEETDD